MQGTAEKGAGEEERRRDEGPGEGAKEVVREEERKLAYAANAQYRSALQ